MNLSCAVIAHVNTLFGNVNARLTTSRAIKTFAVAYSESVKPLPKIPLIFPNITQPHKMHTTESDANISKNIPFSRATPSSSFFAL